MAAKKLTIAGLALVGILAFSGCSGTASVESGASTAAEATAAAPAAPLDLVGEWKQSNSSDASSYQEATISGETITVNWVNETESTTALYWAGTYVPPTDASDSYSWDSANDTAQTDSAMLASGDPTKTFTYTDGKLSYDVTAMGVTKTVELERE